MTQIVISETAKDLQDVAKQVSDALAVKDYTLAELLLRGHSYKFKKKIEQMIPAVRRQLYEQICP
ncbi:MAG TPA: hypothetical protein PLS56_01345 [Candidatus Dojkabacteria bacterium]|nr:hypothetical protein [Candidatus Dojkabacteria bacterium]